MRRSGATSSTNSDSCCCLVQSLSFICRPSFVVFHSPSVPTAALAPSHLLCWLRFLRLPSNNSGSNKNVRSDHSHNGRQPRAIRGSLPEAPWLSDVPSCPSLAWGGCGGVEFPRTCVAPHPGPTFSTVDGIEISVKVMRHNRKLNLWKTSGWSAKHCMSK